MMRLLQKDDQPATHFDRGDVYSVRSDGRLQAGIAHHAHPVVREPARQQLGNELHPIPPIPPIPPRQELRMWVASG